MEALRKAAEARLTVPVEPADLDPSLDRIAVEVESDETLIRDAIDMVHLFF